MTASQTAAVVSAPGRFKVGERVRAERSTPPRGTWKRYAGREGVVRVAGTHGEVGVQFGGTHGYSWFLRSELVVIEPDTAPRERQEATSRAGADPHSPGWSRRR